jgi:hypothetical protein
MRCVEWILRMLPIMVAASACMDGLAPTEPGSGRTPAVPPEGASLTAGGPIIRHHPGESPGPGYYALFLRGFVPNDGGWVGIVFIRSPSCVPAGFNLLDWFDRPTAFGCQLTVEGDEWWHSLSEPPPFQLRENGLGAVPVYFVRLSELETAMADDVLTITELQGLPSLLVGSASYLLQVVHNTNQPTNHGHETLVSRGTLDDGRTFEFRYNEKFLPETQEHVFPNVKIEFR